MPKTCKKCGKEFSEDFTFCPYCGKSTLPKRRKANKHANGSGSVYKRNDRKEKPWVAYSSASYTEEGECRRVYLGQFETAAEARAAVEAFNDNPTPKYAITLEKLFEEWKSISYPNISRQTQDNYNACWLKLDSIKKHKVKDIRTGELQAIIDHYSDMSNSTLSKLKALLTQLFDYAMQNDIVNKNYASFLVLPKTEKKKKDAFSMLEVAKIQAAAEEGVEYADYIMCMIYTGFRITEFLSLTRFEYSESAQTLTGGMKTEAGKGRIVPIHPKIKKYVQSCVEAGGETIFCRSDGKAFSSRSFREEKYYPTLRQIGVRELSPHSTRHTFCTMLSSAGVRTENITALAGHEDYSMTANTYVHQDIESLREAIAALA